MHIVLVKSFLLNILHENSGLHIISVRSIYKLKPGSHEPHLPVERSVTLFSSIVVDRRRCALQVSSVARLQENKTWFTQNSTAS